jgi:hypothetical protein
MELECKKGKPSYNKTNNIGPAAMGKGKSGKMDKSMWGNGAMGSEIAGESNYMKKGKKGTVKKPSVKPNSIGSN